MSGFTDLVTALGESILAEDIYVKAGASWEIAWDLVDASGTAIDISAAVVRCEVRPAYTETPIFTFATSGATGTVTQTAAGHLALKATPSATAGLASTVTVAGIYDVKVTSSGGQVAYISQGNFYIIPEVTV